MKKIYSLIVILSICCLAVNAQILYKVEKPGSDKVSYIFGTHHLAPLSTLTDMPEAMQAMQEADAVVGEVDMTQDQMAMAMKLLPFMQAPSDSVISKLLSPEEYSILITEFQKWSPQPGMGIEMLDGFKPMVVSSMVALSMIQQDLTGYDPSEQLDTYVQTIAAQQGKILIPLETAEQQGEILYNSTPIAKQAEMLMDMMANPEKSLTETKKLNKLYADHDVSGLLEMTQEESADSPFMQAILTKRNCDWITKLPKIFDQYNAFVAVGALHLPGDKGILHLLESDGYQITPIR